MDEARRIASNIANGTARRDHASNERKVIKPAVTCALLIASTAFAYDRNTGRCEHSDFAVDEFNLHVLYCVGAQCSIRMTGKLTNKCLNPAGLKMEFVAEDDKGKVLGVFPNYPVGPDGRMKPGEVRAFTRTVVVPKGKVKVTVNIIEVYQP